MHFNQMPFCLFIYTSKIKYFGQNFSIALQPKIKKKTKPVWIGLEKRISRIFWRKLLFSPAPLVTRLEFNILIKEAFSWKELRYKQSLIYTSRSWGTKKPKTKPKQSRSRQASLISYPFSFPVAEGICLSQISLAWKNSMLHVFPRQWEEHNENRSKTLQASNSAWCEHSQPAMPGD